MLLFFKRRLEWLKRPLTETWLKLLVTELLVVFVGVYAADLLGEWHEERARNAREVLLLRGLQEDIGPFLEQFEGTLATIRTGYDAWTEELERGARPPPFFIAATFSMSRPHGALWNAMLQSGGLDLLPVDMLADISEFYVRSERLIDRYGRLDDFVKMQILPNIENGEAVFFKEGGTSLRPMFATYIEEAVATIGYAEDTVALGRRIQSRLAAQQ